jgi:hypothetical protein
MKRYGKLIRSNICLSSTLLCVYSLIRSIYLILAHLFSFYLPCFNVIQDIMWVFMLQCNSICLVKVFLEKYTAFSAKFLFFVGKLNEILQKNFINECKNLLTISHFLYSHSQRLITDVHALSVFHVIKNFYPNFF